MSQRPSLPGVDYANNSISSSRITMFILESIGLRDPTFSCTMYILPFLTGHYTSFIVITFGSRLKMRKKLRVALAQFFFVFCCFGVLVSFNCDILIVVIFYVKYTFDMMNTMYVLVCIHMVQNSIYIYTYGRIAYTYINKIST